MSWLKSLFGGAGKGTGETGGKSVDKSSWAYKCEHLGTVVASNEHGAFALNRTKRQLWLATPESAFQVNAGAFQDHAFAISALHTVWRAKCKGSCPITEDSFREIWSVFG